METGADIWLPLADVADANLILTDELIDAARTMLKAEHPDFDPAVDDGIVPEIDAETEIETDQD